MSSVIPQALAFHFEFPVRQLKALPKKGSRLLDLSEEFQLPWPGATLGAEQHAALIDLRIAWNTNGIGISCVVSGKQQRPVAAHPERPAEGDGLQVWIDTRNTQTIHRGNRFCHQFCLSPGGDSKSSARPQVHQLPMARAVEDAPQHEPDSFRIWSDVTSQGYALEAWLPATVLNGFDVEVCSQLGFYCVLRDAELGEHSLTVGTEFPVATDPSLWQTLDLQED